MGYTRQNEYTWRETFWAGLGKLDRIRRHGTGHCGFDWRWLAQTIRHNLEITEVRRFPFGVLPVALSSSVFFVAEPRRPKPTRRWGFIQWGLAQNAQRAFTGANGLAASAALSAIW
jgi:hypothetical protein